MTSDASDTYYLDVPFKEKDEVKARGARWDPVVRKWHVTRQVYAKHEPYFRLRRTVAKIKPGEEAEKPFTVPIHPYQFILTQDKAPMSHPAPPRHLEHFEQGCQVENAATIALLAAGYHVMQANATVDQYHHVDCFITTTPTSETSWQGVDVKAIKCTHDPWLTYVEVLHANGGPGWVFGDADLILFELPDRFVAVQRDMLADHAMALLSFQNPSDSGRPRQNNADATPLVEDVHAQVRYPCRKGALPTSCFAEEEEKEGEASFVEPAITVHLNAHQVCTICPERCTHSGFIFGQVVPVVESPSVAHYTTPFSPKARRRFLLTLLHSHAVLAVIDLRQCPMAFSIPKIPLPTYPNPIYDTTQSAS